MDINQTLRQDEVKRAAHARSLLDDPILSGAFTEVEAAIIEQIKQCPVKDKLLQDKLVTMLQLQERLKNIITEHITTGKLAKAQLEGKTIFNLRGL